MNRYIATICVSSIVALSAFGQERDAPRPELLDEISTVGNCEKGSRSLDDLLISLASNPADEGYIVIYTEKSKIGGSQTRERQLRTRMKQVGGPFERLRIIKAALRDNAKTQFWRVPPGAQMHEIEPLDLSGLRKAPAPTEPYLYGMESFDGIAECKIHDYDLGSYAVHLKHRPQDRGKIVIGATTRSRFIKKRRGILSILADGGIPANRVKINFVKSNAGPLSETVELWIIPRK